MFRQAGGPLPGLWLSTLLVLLASLSACHSTAPDISKGTRITVTRYEVFATPAPQRAPDALPTAVLNGKTWKPDAMVSTTTDGPGTSVWLRIPAQQLLTDSLVMRVVSVGGTGAATFYGPNGGVRTRGYGLPTAGALDKLSLLVGPEWAKGGYIYVHVQPYAFVFENQRFDNTEHVSIRSHEAATYHIVTSNWRPIRYLQQDLVFAGMMGGVLVLALFCAVFAVAPGQRQLRRAWGYFGAYWLANAPFWYYHLLAHSMSTLPSMGAHLALYIGSQLLMFAAYILFATEIMHTATYYPRGHRFWRLLVPVLGSLAALAIPLLWFGVAPSELYNGFALFRIALCMTAAASSMYLLIVGERPLDRVLAVGTLVFAFSNLAVVSADHPYVFAVGVLVDLLLFGLAIGLRNYRDHVSNLVAERRNRKLEHDVTKARDTALRAQMNPHFVSNVVNALRALVLEGRNDEAYDYLSRFAHFVRVTLGTAERTAHTLAAELAVIEHYVALEELREDRAIAFDYELYDGIQPDKLYVPPLILQPVVENAIIHGFPKHLSRAPGIEITFRVSQHSILAEITDNGIGRDAARSMRLGTARARNSMALNIIAERLDLFDDPHGQQPTSAPLQPGEDPSGDRFLRIDDLYLDGEAIGTRVSLRIRQRTTPIKFEQAATAEEHEGIGQLSFIKRLIGEK